MIDKCVRGQDDCGCDCHRVPGVAHVLPCCDKPPAARWRDWADEKARIATDALSTDFDTNRDPGDESDKAE